MSILTRFYDGSYSFIEATKHLKDCLWILRNELPASEENMRTEIAVSRALEILEASGFMSVKTAYGDKFNK